MAKKLSTQQTIPYILLTLLSITQNSLQLDNPYVCPYPCLPPPIGGSTYPTPTPPTTPTPTPTTSDCPPPPSPPSEPKYYESPPPPATPEQYYYSPPPPSSSGYTPSYEYYPPPGGSTYPGYYGNAPPPPNPILPYFPYYYRNPPPSNYDSSSATSLVTLMKQHSSQNLRVILILLSTIVLLGWRNEVFGVWDAAWLPGVRGGLTPSPNINADPSLRVDAFIDKERGIWKDDELHRVLLADEVHLAHKIPLNKNFPPDILYWWPNKNGIFSVKSGYWLGMGPLLVEGESSVHSGNNGLWRRLWSLPLPPKLIHFLWRACNGTLAVRVNLMRRHCCPTNLCEFCEGAEETELHALFLCPWASAQWEMSSFANVVCAAPLSSFSDWLVWILEQLPGVEKGHFLAVIWALWALRNSRLFEEEQRSPEVTVLGFTRLVQDYCGYMQRVGGASMSTQEVGGVQWLKPDVGVIKINTDAAVMEDGTVGLGVVARDCHGGVMLVASKRVRAGWDVEIAETKAMAFGLELAVSHGFAQVVIESDALNVVRRCLNEWWCEVRSVFVSKKCMIWLLIRFVVVFFMLSVMVIW